MPAHAGDIGQVLNSSRSCESLGDFRKPPLSTPRLWRGVHPVFRNRKFQSAVFARQNTFELCLIMHRQQKWRLMALFCSCGEGGIRSLQLQFRLYDIFPHVKISTTFSNPQTVPRTVCSPCVLRSLRRGRDSNPRSSYPDSNLAGCCIRPLCHLSLLCMLRIH